MEKVQKIFRSCPIFRNCSKNFLKAFALFNNLDKFNEKRYYKFGEKSSENVQNVFKQILTMIQNFRKFWLLRVHNV